MDIRRLSAVVLVFALIVVGCSDDDDETEAVDLPDGAAAVVEDYYETVAQDHDGDGMLGLVTDDFEFVSHDGALDRETWAAQVDLFFDDFSVERFGERVVVGEGTAYIVSQPEHTSGTGIDDQALSVMRVVEVDGTWLLANHYYLPASG